MARDEEAARYRLGADVGGTHTDLEPLDTETGELFIEEVASTPDNPAHGVLGGIARFVGRRIAASASPVTGEQILGMLARCAATPRDVIMRQNIMAEKK